MDNTRHYSFIHSGQTITEMAILMMVIVFALIAMQLYLKRGIQGRLRENIDSIGGQYDPERTTSDTITNQSSLSTTYTATVEADGRAVTTSIVETPYENSFTCSYEIVDGA